MEDYPDPVSCGYEVFEMQVKVDLEKQPDMLAGVMSKRLSRGGVNE
jgi:hypothetical protein